MAVILKHSRFDPYAELQTFEEQLHAEGRFGAVANFIGVLRDFNDGHKVYGMTLEYYPGMTQTHLAEIESEAQRSWPLVGTLIIHRVGEIQISEAIVLTAAWAAHRSDAFSACRLMIEALKSKAPFWKQETLESGKRWVTKNTPSES